MQQHHDELQVIKLNMQYLFLKNFTYIIFDSLSKEAVIVDPAWKIDNIEQTLRLIGAKLTGILVTHTHLDHVHLVKPLEKKYHCPVWLSLKEYESSSFRCRGLQVLEDEQYFFCGSIKVMPLLTPGHTPGSMCYRIGDNLFTGDTLFTEGCGMCTGSMANPHDMFFSLQRLKASIHMDMRIFPGHSFGKIPGKNFAEVLKHNLYLSFEKEENFVAFRMRKGQKNLFHFQWGSD